VEEYTGRRLGRRTDRGKLRMPILQDHFAIARPCPMRVPFSQLPGAHERHYRRKLANPLFPDGPGAVDDDALLEVQRLDHEALVAFIADLRRLIAEAVGLPPTAESDQVLSLKERLDKAYETACGLADEQERNKAAIRRLLEVMMRAVRTGASGDPRAEAELEQETQARDLHYRLLEHPLVADLLAPESPIGPDELAPTLLSAEPEGLEAALDLFDTGQLALIVAQSRDLLSRSDPGGGLLAEARDRLARLEARLADCAGQPLPGGYEGH